MQTYHDTHIDIEESIKRACESMNWARMAMTHQAMPSKEPIQNTFKASP